MASESPPFDSIPAGAEVPEGPRPAPLTPNGLVALADLEAPPHTSMRLPFPVVGIGASAGGVEVIRQLFKAMPSGNKRS